MEVISAYIDSLCTTLQSVEMGSVLCLLDAVYKVMRNDGNIFLCGNGGSAANASHLASDLSTTIFIKTGRKLNAVALTDSVPIMTAIANDISNYDVFKYQLIGRISKDDLFVGLSGSGDSENIVRAAQYAHRMRALTCAIIGQTGGRLKEMVDIPLHIPTMSMQIAEDLQLIIGHILTTCMIQRAGSDSYGCFS